MRVGILCKPLDKPFSGSGSHLKGLLSALSDIDHDIEITLLSYSRLDSRFTDTYKNIVLTGNYLIDNYKINKCNFDIVHYHPLTIFSPVFVKARRFATIHGASGVALRHESGLIRYLHDKYLRRLLANRMDHIFTVSDTSRNWLEENYKLSSGLLTVVHNGVSEQIIKLFQDGQLREGFCKRDFVLHVSNYSKRKNPNMVLNVFRELAMRNPNLNFLIVGNGWVNNDVVTDFIISHSLVGRIKTLGFVDDAELAGLYSRAKVLFSPSLYEGFGMPNIEAMYSGTPVVISQAFAAGSICGSAAHVSNSPDDLNFFVEAISRLTSDKDYWDCYSEKSVLRANCFCWRTSALKTLALYGQTDEAM